MELVIFKPPPLRTQLLFRFFSFHTESPHLQQILEIWREGQMEGRRDCEFRRRSTRSGQEASRDERGRRGGEKQRGGNETEARRRSRRADGKGQSRRGSTSNEDAAYRR